MRGNPSSNRKVLLLAAMALALVSAAQAAPKFKILHAFGKGSDGGGLWGSLVLDAEGNLYGTTSGGGGDGCNGSGCGTVFELSPHADGHWRETIIHRFDGTDGAYPMDGLAFDATGDLYGMGNQGFGTVFELFPGQGHWDIALLLDSGDQATLVLDQQGNLYGPFGGGEYSGGVISELVKADGWADEWLYSFCPKGGKCLDGAIPFAGVTWGPDGSLYGTTTSGGSGGYGVVFRLTPQQDGTWKETVLHSFPAFLHDGQKPYEGVVLDQAENVYGATAQGGSSTNCGVIFKLAPQANGKWKETILYNFPKVSRGCTANTPGLDSQGNLWGTAQGGTSGNGVVFELTPQASGKWKYSAVHQFNWNDGSFPGAAVIFDGKGNLYGTTILGGTYGNGVVFELTP